MKILFLQF